MTYFYVNFNTKQHGDSIMIKKALLTLFFIFIGNSLLNAKNLHLELTQLVNEAFEQEEAKNQVINLAALNKMLSQRMAKDAILITQNINVDYYTKDLMDSGKKFDLFIQGMYKGNESLKLPKQTDKEILSELNEINAVWKEFHIAIQNFYKNKKVDKEAYAIIINQNEKLMRLSHKLTQTLQSKHILDTQDNQVIVHTLKFADRQRMLTQKMFKEKFLVYTKEDAERNNVRLRGSIILFKNGLEGLIKGDHKRGLKKVTSKPIQDKLQEMHELYNEVEDLYKKDNVVLKELKHLASIDKKLMGLSIEVVTMIENTLVY
ncbi:MAG: Unknown protein [uncultured Sulfurovum sp.]|uniref:NarX-like N-terminal domain-containing protein n=1 Tax=uncultured Sulfurovum sp. TaxID=269237 RepID=A0A6S6TK35_9BACT|nr:MAG: Unknown protein [uncultured Sulfurovum sp.]